MSNIQQWLEFQSAQGSYRKPVRRTRLDMPIARAVLDPLNMQHSGTSLRARSVKSRRSIEAKACAVQTRVETPIIEPVRNCQSSQPSGDASDGSELLDPVSAIAGRSGFFASPTSQRQIEVRLRSMDPRKRAEYDQVSNLSGFAPSCQFSQPAESLPSPSVLAIPEQPNRNKKRAPTLEQTTRALNLGRFAYSSGAPKPTATASSGPKKGARHRRERTVKDKTAMNKRPRARRDEILRARSSWARAFHHHQHNTGGTH